MTFYGSQKIIGKGAQAEVLLYHGFAYKVYKESYPAEWIAFEKKQQQAVNKAGLCSVKYYDTDNPHIIKMDLVEGNQLEKSVVKNPEQGFALLARAFRFVHQADESNTTIPPLASTATKSVPFPSSTSTSLPFTLGITSATGAPFSAR